jgi:CubicO group peptidase (beta-lactamase class C family)
MTNVEVHGFAEPGYGKVAAAFAANFDAGEVGAAVAVEVGGARVVDLWAGDADPGADDTPEGGRRWRADTLAVMFSCGKGVTTLCLYLLVQDGPLDLDQPSAAYWPEFAAEGKDRLTVRQALAHRAGLPVVDGPTTRDDVLDWDTMTSRLAAQAPMWEPNSGYSYHAVTFGWLAGEIIRRLSGQLPGDFLASRLTGPLGLELWIGLPASEHGRVARILPPTPSAEQLAAPVPTRTEVDEVMDRTVSLNGGLASPGQVVFSVFTEPEILSAQFPAANGVATARSLARLYSCAVTGEDRLLTRESISDATRTVSTGPSVFDVDDGFNFGTGFGLAVPDFPMLGPRSFGHGGAGGKAAFGDDDAEVGFAYLNNWFGTEPDTRADSLIDALRTSLG